MRKHHILITNDDGIHSPGLRSAVEAVKDLGTISVVAPSNQQTGTGRGLTGNKQATLVPFDFIVDGAEILAFSGEGSPALIVRHSLRTIFKDAKPDLLVSGINYGENLGFNITSSGTVGAALEASSFGIPAIAASLQTDVQYHHSYVELDWSASIHFVHKFARSLLSSESYTDVDVLKIDIPASASPSTDWKMTKLARSFYYDRIIQKPTTMSAFGDGKTIVRVNPDTLDKESDIYALAVDKVVSVTPLSLDLTSRVNLPDLQDFYK